MKKRRVSREELKKMSSLVFVWKTWLLEKDGLEHQWHIAQCKPAKGQLDICDDIDKENITHASSFEEALLRAQVMFPGEKLLEVDDIEDGSSFIAPNSHYYMLRYGGRFVVNEVTA